MAWYEDLIAVFVDDGGLWTVTSNWKSAREFVSGVILKSDMSEIQRNKLQEKEEILYSEYYNRSGYSGLGIVDIANYSDSEIKLDISKYSNALYDWCKQNEYPEQVIKVFAGLAEVTYSVSNPETELGPPIELIIPTWVKYLAAAGILYLFVKK